MWFCLPILIILNLATSLSGLAIYSKYFKCDPKTVKKIDKSDMLLPYYVMDSMSAIPGLPGLIVAGKFFFILLYKYINILSFYLA